MKRNLLSSIIIGIFMTTGLSACDDKDDKKANESISYNTEQLASDPQVESGGESDALNQKLNVYVDCYNNLQQSIYRSVGRYANTFDDFKSGPTGNEVSPSPVIPIYPAFIEDCRKDIKIAAELKPVFASLDTAAKEFIAAAAPLAETINDINKYYSQQNYKDDAFAGGKALHQKFIKQFYDFEPIAKKYNDEITAMSRQRDITEINATEKKEGKSVKYYTLLTIREAEDINDAVAGDSFDVVSVAKQLTDFETHTQQLNKKVKANIDKYRSFPGFISELEKLQEKVKKRIRRVRDNVAYTEHEQSYLKSDHGDLVDGSYDSVVKAYNELIGTYNSYHLERAF